MIDWTTVLFQIINFLIIVWILKRYLFTPVVKAMDRREKAIRTRLHSAENMKRDAEEQNRLLESKLAAIGKKRAEILADAHTKADAERGNMMRSLNKDIEELREEELREILEERAELMRSVSEVAAKSVIDIANAALRDLANSSIQKALVENFATRATRENIAGVHELKKCYKKSGRLSVNASFNLDAAEKKRISSALAKLIGVPVRIKFGLDEKIVFGIEVVCESLVISFGLGDYIAKLKSNLDDELAVATRTPPRARIKKGKG